MVMESGSETPVIMGFSEDSPSADEAAFSENEPQTVSVSVADHLPNVLLATSQGIITSEQLQQAGIKATHIVIHDQSALDVFKTAQASLAAQSSSDEGSGTAQKFKYNWDESVHEPELLVRCRNVSGQLHKNKFGSGGRGRCIKSGSRWYTPSEFEALCGRANSKDWKRSIRYAGRTLLCLIEDGILMPHATSCTCAACCDDMVVSGPVRLYTPYKRKKKEEAVTVGKSSDEPPEKLPALAPKPAPSKLNDCSPAVEAAVVASRLAPMPSDFTEQRQWWQLEEMVKNLAKQVQELQKQVDLVKAQSVTTREAALERLRVQLENEKKEAMNNTWLEAQLSLSRGAMEVGTEKEASQSSSQASGTAEKDLLPKRCTNCNREALLECTGCHRVSYCSPFCQRKDWNTHQQSCSEEVVEEPCIVDKGHPVV
uniref:Putative deformed epidermal autoregulatory factor 1 n=1 Tax=Hyalomma excavatum TaxID=257692 RepID=A0A131XKL6_9ACAR